VQLAISDAHAGLKAAITRVLGCAWQRCTRPHPQHGSPINTQQEEAQDVAWSPDGRLLATARKDGNVRFFNPATGRPVGPGLVGHTGAVWAVAFDPTGRTIATGSIDDSVRIWDVAIRRPLGPPMTGHSDYVLSVALTRDGRTLASGARHGTMRL
jgi:WD40 repeat protein